MRETVFGVSANITPRGFVQLWPSPGPGAGGLSSGVGFAETGWPPRATHLQGLASLGLGEPRARRSLENVVSFEEALQVTAVLAVETLVFLFCFVNVTAPRGHRCRADCGSWHCPSRSAGCSLRLASLNNGPSEPSLCAPAAQGTALAGRAALGLRKRLGRDSYRKLSGTDVSGDLGPGSGPPSV